ncbi:MAG: hypothetical protein HLUCCA12_09230 [Rhodobacteraceae bacterium HLUCCA12]|nr:MAG: hypothetical protein HLUCCA12_09230 [Rhodobacteraceae bacterium HLUCCA12]
MRAVGLGDVSAAARALMAVPEPARPALMRRLLDEAAQADRYRLRRGRAHPVLGNGTLMARALACPLADVAGPGDPAYLAALAQVIEAVLDRRCATAETARR